MTLPPDPHPARALAFWRGLSCFGQKSYLEQTSPLHAPVNGPAAKFPDLRTDALKRTGELDDWGEHPAIQQEPHSEAEAGQKTQGNDDRPARQRRVDNMWRPGS